MEFFKQLPKDYLQRLVADWNRKSVPELRVESYFVIDEKNLPFYQQAGSDDVHVAFLAGENKRFTPTNQEELILPKGHVGIRVWSFTVADLSDYYRKVRQLMQESQSKQE